MEEEGYEPPRSSTVVLPTAPRAALGPGIDDERIPHRPPFTAYIANLPYDVDESEIRDTFEKARLKVEKFIKELKNFNKRSFNVKPSSSQVSNCRLKMSD